MNHVLIESLAQTIFNLSSEERRLLYIKIPNFDTTLESTKISLKTIEENIELGTKLVNFQTKYNMSSENFYELFQAGELEDSIDFFEWNAYYKMLSNSMIEA